MRRRTAAALSVAALALGLSACGSGSTPGTTAPSPSASASTSVPGRTTPAPWDRPADQDAQVRKAGLSLTPSETLAVHYHAHLDVLVDGSPVPVPAGLGINAGPNGALPPHGSPGIAPLHTHDTSGVLHVEAPKADRFTLGQAFTLWDVALGPGRIGGYADGDAAGHHVRVYVDGKQVGSDPAQITLTDHEEIAVVVTTGDATPSKVPTGYDWSGV